MADGSMPTNRPGAWSTHLRSVMGFPYMPRLNEGVIEVSRPGACDPDMKQLLARLCPHRFATVAIRFTRDAVTGNLLATAGTTFTIFDKGTGEAGSGGFAGVLTGSETNAVEQGGLVPSGTRWYSVGAICQWQAAYQVAAGADAAGTRTYAVNLDTDPGGYSKRLARAVADCSYLEINHGTGNACRYSMGPAGLWNNAVGDGSQAYNGQGGVPGTFLWFSTPDESTGKNEDGALRATFTITHDLVIENDGLNPTTAQADVILPLKVVLMGFPLCEPRELVYAADGRTMNMDELTENILKRVVSILATPEGKAAAGRYLSAGR